MDFEPQPFKGSVWTTEDNQQFLFKNWLFLIVDYCLRNNIGELLEWNWPAMPGIWSESAVLSREALGFIWYQWDIFKIKA